MKKVLVFGSSNSSKSINKKLAIYTAQHLTNAELIIIDLNDFQLPIYNPDLQQAEGIAPDALRFNELLASVDGIVLSMAEYNGNYTTVFKNMFDWVSRIDKDVWKNKPMLLLGTSPGRRGAKSVLKIATDAFPFYSGNIVASFSLPQFHQNFGESGIQDETLLQTLKEQVAIFQ
ncbi:MAG: NAD(P)H-dependent oxidoreductase, partial [Bacteroidota bacterium]